MNAITLSCHTGLSIIQKICSNVLKHHQTLQLLPCWPWLFFFDMSYLQTSLSHLYFRLILHFRSIEQQSNILLHLILSSYYTPPPNPNFVLHHYFYKFFYLICSLAPVKHLNGLSNSDHAVLFADISFESSITHEPPIHKNYFCYLCTD